jgi:hypothetical protein
MSLSVYPVFERSLKRSSKPIACEILGDCFGILDELSAEAGLTPISGFGDNREIPEGFDGPPEALDELLGPCNAWFDSTAGVAALQALAKTLISRHDFANRLEDPEGVVSELRELASLLEAAASEGVRFRLKLG